MNVDNILSAIKNILDTTSMSAYPSLFNGDLGRLLFLITYNDAYGINDETLIQRLETVIEDSLNYRNSSFSHGLIGLGWFLQNLISKNILDKEDVEELLLQLDDVSYSAALDLLKNNNHDFLHGGIGSGIYLLCRYNENPKAKEYLEHIITELYNTGKRTAEGMYWIENESEFYAKDSTVLLGLAHGSASKITFLSKMIAHGIAEKRSEMLLKDSISFLQSTKFKKDMLSVYPTSIDYGKKSGSSRLAWCHGDLGISIALLHAGKVLKDEALVQEAITICLRTTKRKEQKETDIVDAGFCHGIAGITHMYKRMHQYTGIDDFEKAANYWLKKIEEAAAEKPNLKGLSAWDNYNEVWEWNPGLLVGLSGIGLVLLSHLNDKVSGWDSCMLLS